MTYRNKSSIDLVERFIGAACYLPMGFFIGVGYILLKGRHSNGYFFRFNFYQGIIVQMGLLVIQMGAESVTGIFTAILRMFEGVAGDIVPTLVSGISWTVSLLVAALGLLLFYGLIWSLLGKYAEIPWISNVVRQNFR